MSIDQTVITFAKALADEKINAIYTSDLLRAVQTAEPLASRLDLPIVKTAAFRERQRRPPSPVIPDGPKGRSGTQIRLHAPGPGNKSGSRIACGVREDRG